MNEGLPLQAGLASLCLVAVLLLIAGAGRLARRFPALQAARQSSSPIVHVGSLSLDRTHRLHVVEISGQRALVLTGGQGAVLPLETKR